MTRAQLYIMIIIALAGLPRAVFGQRCGTTQYTQAVRNVVPQINARYGASNSDPALNEKLATLTGVVHIPVSVHVIWRIDEENISDALIQQQIDQVNKDLSGTNEDLPIAPDYFRAVAADCQIHLDLVKIDHHQTQVKIFDCTNNDSKKDDPSLDPIKFNLYGGENGDASTQYLNIWIGNIKHKKVPGILGYGTFPGGVGRNDGIVLLYKAVGPNPNFIPYEKGRTLTHEFGHWLNLQHIWGDQTCGDDSVADTPTQETCTTIIRTRPHPSCGNEPNGDMFVNFMDYTPDAGMVMFTEGQKARMRANFVEGGPRASFVQNTLANNLRLIDNSSRNDINTPILSFVKDVGASNQSKLLIWKSIAPAKNYIVETRELGAINWSKTSSSDTTFTMKSLRPGQYYEVRLSTVDQQQNVSTPSSPYIFKNVPVLSNAKTTFLKTMKTVSQKLKPL